MFLTKPTKGRVERNRVLTVAVDADGNPTAGVGGVAGRFLAEQVFLTRSSQEQDTTNRARPRNRIAAPPSYSPPHLACLDGPLGSVVNNIGDGIRMLRVAP